MISPIRLFRKCALILCSVLLLAGCLMDKSTGSGPGSSQFYVQFKLDGVFKRYEGGAYPPYSQTQDTTVGAMTPNYMFLPEEYWPGLPHSYIIMAFENTILDTGQDENGINIAAYCDYPGQWRFGIRLMLKNGPSLATNDSVTIDPMVDTTVAVGEILTGQIQGDFVVKDTDTSMTISEISFSVPRTK